MTPSSRDRGPAAPMVHAPLTTATGSAEPFLEVDDDVVAVGLADGCSNGGGDRQLVRPVSERHERTAERDAVDGAGHLDEAARAEHPGRVGHLHAGPRVTVTHA